MTALERMKARLGADATGVDDALLEDYLESAKAAILAKRYPYEEPPEELPVRYADLQIRIAIVFFSRRGMEGESSHTETAATRVMEDMGKLLSEVTPLGKVMSRA